MMATVANQPKTPHRTIRVPDEVWLPAKVKAESEGSNLSEKIREWLVAYVDPINDGRSLKDMLAD